MGHMRNFEEGVIVTERMRRDALRLRRALLHRELPLAWQLIRAIPKSLGFNTLKSTSWLRRTP